MLLTSVGIWREMPSPRGHSVTQLSCRAYGLYLHTPSPRTGTRGRGKISLCQEIFLGGISEILNKDVIGDIGTNLYLRTVPHLLRMLRHPTSVETPVIARILKRRGILAGSFSCYFFPFHLPASLSIYFSYCLQWFPKKRSLSPIFAARSFLFVANPWDQF